jgi:hypothetical protein
MPFSPVPDTDPRRSFILDHCSGTIDYGGKATGLTTAQFRAINKYTSSSQSINDGSDKANARLIRNAIAKNTIDSPVTLYRGINDHPLSQDLLKRANGDSIWGKEFSVSGFSSTSIAQGVAERFDNGVLLKISVDAGSHCIGISGSEGEIILQSKSRFRIDGVSNELRIGNKSGDGATVKVISCTYLGA